jgi:hypothetical protein
MAGRVLGDAIVVISPSTAGFRQLADAQIRKDLAGLKPTVTLGANTREINAAITGLQARIKAMSDKLTTLRFGADGSAAEATVIRLQARLAGLIKMARQIVMSADTTKLNAQIAAEQANLRKLQQQASDLKLDADAKAALSKIAALRKEAFHLQEDLDKGKLKADVDIKAAEARLRAIDAELRVLGDKALKLKLSADNKALLAAIAESEAKVAALTSEAKDIRLGANVDTAKLLAVDAGLTGIEAAMAKLAPAAAAGDAALGVLGKALVGTGTGWGFLTRSVVLFGGAFNRILPVVASSVAVWHVLADAIIEIGAVWIPATLAVGAFAFAASDAAKQVQIRMQALHTELDATGRSIPQLSTGFEALHKAVQPQVYQLFGDALTIIHSKTGQFATIAQATGTVVDRLAARITYAVTQGGGFNTFMGHAVTDVAKLGDSIGNVAGIFGNFFKVIPGFATGLLTIGDDFTKVLEAASAAAEPVIKWTLLLHGYILYTGLAVTVTLAFIGGIANLAKQFVTFASGSVLAGVNAIKGFVAVIKSGGLLIYDFITAVAALIAEEGLLVAAQELLAAVNPFVWVAAAAIALGALAVTIGRSKDAAQQFNDTMQKTIQNASLASVVTTIQQAQASTAVQLAGANKQLNTVIAEQGKHTGIASRSWGDETAAMYNARKATDELTSGQQQLDAQQQLVTGRFAALSKEFGGNTAALGALNAAGITTAQITDKNSQHWAQALIQVNSTTKAYQAMGTQAGTLGNDLDVLGRTVTDQYQAIQKLNQGWASFISDVTGTQGSFDTVAQGFATLADHSGKLNFTLGKLKVSYKDTNAAIDSLTPAGIALNQAFGDQVVNTDKLYASWRTAGIAGNLFTQGVKDSIAPLTKYANGSQEATAQLVALAQEAGYQGPISMQALTKWLGNTHGATQKLKDITDQATTQEALLTGAMQNQGTFIANQLIGDINSAILSYNGVGKAAAAYGLAIAQSGRNSDAAVTAQKNLAGAIVKSGTAIGDSAKTIEATLAKVLGISMPQAAALFNAAMKGSSTAVQAATATINAGFTKQGNAAKTATTGLLTYTDEIRINGAASAAAKPYRDQLVKDLIAAGVNSKTANSDVSNYTSAVRKNGIDSDAARAARQKLIADIASTTANSKTGKTDLDALSTAIQRQGSNSSAAESARARLIADIRATGVDAKTATGLVDNMQLAINAMHGKTVTVIAEAQGSGTISITGSGWALGQGNIRFHAAGGGLVNLGSGPTADDVPAMLSKGELVVPAKMVKSGAVDHLRGSLPGFAAGGLAGLQSTLAGAGDQAGSISGTLAGKAVTTGVAKAMAAAKAEVLKAVEASISSAGSAGLPGPGGAGTLSAVAIEGYWTRAGGPGGQTANIAQAITVPESGRRPSAVQQGQPYATTGWGLWQITPGNSEPQAGINGALLNPANNAVAAVAKYRGAGGFTPWTTYVNGLYRPYLLAAGGLVPGMATGGTAGTHLVTGLATGGGVSQSAWLPKLRSAQASEYGDYAGLRKAYLADLAHAAKGSWTAGHRAGIISELGTLAGRQSAEEAAYDRILGGGASKANLSHFATLVRDVATTSRDVDLSHSHPGYTHGLQSWLGTLGRLAGQTVTGAGGGTGSGTGGGTGSGTAAPKLQFAPWLAQLKGLQSDEAADYAGLAAAFAQGPAKYRTASATTALKLLARRQADEMKAYTAIAGQTTGVTPALLASLANVTWSELTASKAGVLSHTPGGHPGWVKGLVSALTAMNKTGQPGTEPYNPVWQPTNIGPVMSVPGGVLTFDRGGILRPGPNLTWNGTGRPEHLVPAGHGGGDVHLHLTVHGPVGSQSELEDWYVRTANKMARIGRLSQAVRAAGG